MMPLYDLVLAVLLFGSVSGAILAGAYAIEQRGLRQAEQRRAEEAEMWADEYQRQACELQQQIARLQRQRDRQQALYAALVQERLAASAPIVAYSLRGRNDERGGA